MCSGRVDRISPLWSSSVEKEQIVEVGALGEMIVCILLYLQAVSLEQTRPVICAQEAFNIK